MFGLTETAKKKYHLNYLERNPTEDLPTIETNTRILKGCSKVPALVPWLG